MKLNTSMLLLTSVLVTPTLGFSQSPLSDAFKGAVGEAARSLSPSASSVVNNALNVPQTNSAVPVNPPFNAGINQRPGNAGIIPRGNAAGAFTPGASNVNGIGSGQSVVGNTVQGLVNGQSFGTALQNSLDMNANGYRLSGQMNNQLQQQYGLQPGDVIVDQNGRPVRDASSLNQWLQSSDGYRVQRDGRVIQLGSRVNNSTSMQPNSSVGNGNPRRLGITMESTLNSAIVSTVDQNSLAARSGLRVGDRIVSYNGQPITGPDNLINYVAASDNEANIVVDRNGRRESLFVRFDGLQSATGSTQLGPQNRNSSSDDYQSLSRRIDNIERALFQIQQTLNVQDSANGGLNAEVQSNTDAPNE